MSQKQIGTVLGLLFAIQIAFVLLLSPLNLPAGSSLAGKLFFLIVMGALLAQPALIALWAGLAPQPFVRRWAQALAMLMCFDLAIAFASAKNASARGDPGEVLQIVTWLVAVAACQLPLWFLRRRFRWQIEALVEPAHPPGGQINQFSISHLLAGMAVVAAFLATLRWLHPDSVGAEWAMLVLRFAAMGVVTSLVGLLALAICWLVLLPGKGGFWRWLIGAGAACVALAAATAVAAFGSPGEVGELVFVLLGTAIWSAAGLFVVRLCGYRLVRLCAGGAAERDTIPASQSIASTPRRFALLVLLLALVLMTLATLAPARLQLWREKEEARRWSESGLVILQKDGKITTVLGDGGVWLASDTVDRINECAQLYHLDLSGSDANDETLVRLGNLPQLAGLMLVGTRIGDRGVEQLGKFRSLRKLNLCMTDVTDDSLVVLAGLKSLESVDLSHTCVTPDGIKWLQETNSKLRVNSIADDATLRRLAMGFRRQRTTAFSQDAASPPPPLRFRATGPLVTDAGVAALRGSTRIEELDLADANVTDAAVKDLATLTGAKKLVLSGTQITDSGAAELQRRLPDCKISR